ncbi:putative F-box/LRR-repeat protein At5g54820 [Ricinus communis]|uniref:F-box domain-containing protein n=1 Tax=Ricinus communis TaxID=3988 RepID=B9T669_RICCO|nr:putative F-box/LRR-repeat protein At5g54820 [Ricinus communis]EEF28641.1 conserved hypothetical protein [Ricinus communis]|eukprot:XP_002533738.1 putative F-box/LRR-repeat protein At5g54820 [Ricinus communis]
METFGGSSSSSSNDKDNTVDWKRVADTTSEGIDYISNLLEVLILHILSFLPLKQWIVVSLLSRQWKYLWTKISILNLNEIEIISNIMKKDIFCPLCGDIPSSYRCLHHSRYAARSKFVEFVDRMLLLHSGSVIDTMRLSFLYDFHDGYNQRIDTWVRYALASNVKELELNFSDAEHFQFFDQKGLTVRHPDPPRPYELPCGSFAPKILKSFILTFCNFRTSNFNVLSSLQKLHLKQLKVLDGSIEEIASKCPVLEDIILEYCLIPDGFFVSKEDIKIKRLSVVHCASNERLRMSISTPNLVMLRIIGECLNSASIQKATHLIDAQIGICVIYTNNADGDALNTLLRGLRHCQSLTVSTWSIQVLPIESTLQQQLPIPLRKVKHLKLIAAISKKELARLSCLLRSCSNLEILTAVLSGPLDLLGFELPNSATDDIFEQTFWESQTLPFPCLRNSLKQLTVTGLMGRINEVEMIMFILKNAVALEKVILLLAGLNKYLCYSPNEFESFQQNLNQIYDFIRTSIQAEVSIFMEPHRNLHQVP